MKTLYTIVPVVVAVLIVQGTGIEKKGSFDLAYTDSGNAVAYTKTPPEFAGSFDVDYTKTPPTFAGGHSLPDHTKLPPTS